MSHPDYKNIGGLKDKLIEETGEVFMALGKAGRFGYFNYHPDRPETNNIMELYKEVDDLLAVCTDLHWFLYPLNRDVESGKITEEEAIQKLNEAGL